MSSYVYVATNSSFPGLVKIGVSGNAYKRMVTLFNTSVPTPFEMSFKLLNVNATTIERMVHQQLESFRITRNREFFRCTIEEASRAIIECSALVVGDGNLNNKAKRKSQIMTGPPFVSS